MRRWMFSFSIVLGVAGTCLLMAGGAIFGIIGAGCVIAFLSWRWWPSVPPWWLAWPSGYETPAGFVPGTSGRAACQDYFDYIQDNISAEQELHYCVCQAEDSRVMDYVEGMGEDYHRYFDPTRIYRAPLPVS